MQRQGGHTDRACGEERGAAWRTARAWPSRARVDKQMTALSPGVRSAHRPAPHTAPAPDRARHGPSQGGEKGTASHRTCAGGSPPGLGSGPGLADARGLPTRGSYRAEPAGGGGGGRRCADTPATTGPGAGGWEGSPLSVLLPATLVFSGSETSVCQRRHCCGRPWAAGPTAGLVCRRHKGTTPPGAFGRPCGSARCGCGTGQHGCPVQCDSAVVRLREHLAAEVGRRRAPGPRVGGAVGRHRPRRPRAGMRLPRESSLLC